MQYAIYSTAKSVIPGALMKPGTCKKQGHIAKLIKVMPVVYRDAAVCAVENIADVNI